MSIRHDLRHWPRSACSAPRRLRKPPTSRPIRRSPISPTRPASSTSKRPSWRSRSPRTRTVVDFANDMVRDHEAVNVQALDLVKKLNVTPEDNDTSKALTKAAADERAKLAKLDGAAFDKAYVDNEVAYHKQVNGALETLLIPSAENAELKSLLETGLKIFQGHQQHAEHVARRAEVRTDHAVETASVGACRRCLAIRRCSRRRPKPSR